MSNWKLTTEQLHDRYVDNIPGGLMVDGVLRSYRDLRSEAFYAWLNSVKAEAYDEALQDAEVSPMPRNPYREAVTE